MSGDVQPRKRKDKRRKKEGSSIGMIHEPVSFQKFKSESEDSKIFDAPEQGEKIHIQNEHGIGGGICVKIIFFCLLGLLVGAVGLIYIQSQGSSDVDLPTVEESRFADYFTGFDYFNISDYFNADEHEHENDHESNENRGYHDHEEFGHDEHDDHEDVEADDENEEENDQSDEQDAIYKLFGVRNDEDDDVHESSITVNKVPGSEDSETEQDVNEDEDGADKSDEIQEVDKGDISDELEQQENWAAENYDKEDTSNENMNDDDDGNEDNHFDALLLEEDDLEEKKNKEKINIVKKNIYNDEIDENDNNDDNYDSADDNENGEEDEDKDENESENEDEDEEEGVKKNYVVEEDEEEEKYLVADDDDLGYEELDVSEDDLHTDSEAEEEETGEEKDKFKEETKKLLHAKNLENEEIKTKILKLETIKEEEETEGDTRGVAIKLGVGIALIIVAHLVLVQKWKSVSNAACAEKAQLEEETAIEKKEIKNLQSSVEPLISRRQTLVSENAFLNEDMNEGDFEEDEYENKEESEEEEDHEEEYEEEEFDKPKNNRWNTSIDLSQNIKSQGNKNIESPNLIKEKEKEERDKEDAEEVEENVEEDEEVEEEEEADEEEEVDEEEDDAWEEEDCDEFEEDDVDDGKNEFKKQKTLTKNIEEMSSDEESKDSTPVPPPRVHRDNRGAQDINEDPLKHFEEYTVIEEDSHESRGAETTGNQDQHSGPEESTDEKTSEKNLHENEWSYRQELDFADEQLEHNPKAAKEAYDQILLKNPTSTRALIGRARALDHWAEKEKSNLYLKQAIQAYRSLLLNNGDRVDNETYVTLAERCIERMRFAGALVSAIEIHKALISKYPNTPKYRNMLAVTYLMMNKISQARVLLNETLSMWPGNGFALVHYGFILKTSDDNMAEGAEKLMAGIQTKEEGVISGMFFFHLGDALHRLGRRKEAMEWYELGVKEGLFLSKYQRSLYNVNRLKGQPWWTKEGTTYQDFFKKLENNWREIRKEGLELLNSKGVNLFKDETENLKDKGDWKQLDLYFRGKKTPNCNRAPITCSLVSSFQPAATCTRGQIKFSVMLPNTHVWPHCGPTNCRLRSHLGLVVPKSTFIRVAEEIRSWEEGKIIIFDDSFEHEVWHNGTGPRLVLIVDVWHPELTNHERRQLSPI